MGDGGAGDVAAVPCRLTAAARFEDRMAHYAWAVLLIPSGHDCAYILNSKRYYTDTSCSASQLQQLREGKQLKHHQHQQQHHHHQQQHHRRERSRDGGESCIRGRPTTPRSYLLQKKSQSGENIICSPREGSSVVIEFDHSETQSWVFV